MAVLTLTASGAKAATSAKLPKNVFAVEINNHQLLKDAYLAYLANGRDNLAKTLRRGEVRGGGIKPWRQKGTGRARFGSIRNPIWRGGGIVFGPTGIENYSRKLNNKAMRVALKQALTLAAKDKNIFVIDSLKATGKVKDMAALLNKIGAKRRVLIVMPQIDDKIKQSTNNLPEISITTAKYLNVYDVLNADSVVITKEAVDIVEQWLGGDK